MEDGYCVKWEKHHNAIVSVFDHLYKQNVLVDCTLAAENKFIKAHRIVLMACSPYFEDILSQHSDNYPIVWMNMKFSELQALIDFCYRGEVRLHQAELPGFLNAARLLHIKGLCESAEGYSSKKRRHMDSAMGNSKKKYRMSGGDGIISGVSGDGGDELGGSVASVRRDGDDIDDDGATVNSKLVVQTNGGDSLNRTQGEENSSDRSDLDTDEESSAGDEKEFIMLDDLIRGSGVSHFLYRWTCSKCGEAFPTRVVYTDHKKVCTAEPAVDHPWRCHKCPNTYKNRKDLVRHLLYCGTETERHICDRCGSTYKYERGLRRHKIYCGTDVKPMVCNACGKTYKYKRGLRRHQKQQCGLVESYLESRSSKAKTADSGGTDTPAKSQVLNKTLSTPKPSLTSSTPAKTEQEDEPETPQSQLKDGFAPAVCRTCGKVYKYRKSYLNHIINCLPDETNDDQEDNNKTAGDDEENKKEDTNEKESPSKVRVKAEVHMTQDTEVKGNSEEKKPKNEPSEEESQNDKDEINTNEEGDSSEKDEDNANNEERENSVKGEDNANEEEENSEKDEKNIKKEPGNNNTDGRKSPEEQLEDIQGTS